MDNFVQAAVNGNGIVSGCGVTALGTPAMGVQVASGVIGYSAIPVTVAAVASLTIAASDPSNARYDVVHVNSAGTVAAITGTPSATPKPPALPATSLLLAYVSVSAGATNIQNSNITNRILGVQAMCLAGVAASRPAAGNAGLLYYATDTSVFSRDNGATWATINNNGALFLAQDGTVAAPGFAFNSETGSGLYRIGAGVVGVSVLGVERARVTAADLLWGTAASTNAGSVGRSIEIGGNDVALFLTPTNASADTWSAAATYSGGAGTGFFGIYNRTVSPSTAALKIDHALAVTLLGPSLSIGTTPATTGVIRVPNGTAGYTYARNAANSADRLLIGFDNTDTYQLTGTWLNVSQSTGVFTVVGSQVIGANAASAGILRIPSQQSVRARNAANNGDVFLIYSTAADAVGVGNGEAVVVPGTSVTIGTNAAATNQGLGGALRLPHSGGLLLRNNANSADLAVLYGTSGADTLTMSLPLVLDGTNYISVGATPATAGTVRLPNAAQIEFRNAANTGDYRVFSFDNTNTLVIGLDVTAGITFGTRVNHDVGQSIALGGGAAPTLGTIGGSGPATAAQNSWLRINIGGTVSYVPIWR